MNEIMTWILSAAVGMLVGYIVKMIEDKYHETDQYQDKVIESRVKKYMKKAQKHMHSGNSKFFQQYGTSFTDIKYIFREHRGKRIDDFSSETGSNVENVERDILSNLDCKQGRAYCITGEYGMGKSTLLLYLFRKLYDSKKLAILAPLKYANNPSNDGTTLISAAVNYLNARYDIKISNLNILEDKIAKGEIILLLDGLDEYVQPLKGFPCELFDDLVNINGKEKVIMTARRNTFQISKHCFKDASRRYNGAGRERKMEIIKLEMLSESEIRKILEEKGVSEVVKEKILSSKCLRDLCGQHLLLEMAVEIASYLNDDFKSADIYEKYVNEVLGGGHDRSSALSALEKIAHLIYNNKKQGITSDKLKEIAGEDLKLNDLPFLSCHNDIYEFTHASFLEFFVARGLVSAIESDKISELTDLRSVAYHNEINIFMKEMISPSLESRLKKLFESKNSRCVKYIGLHSYTNIYKSEKNKEEARNFISKCKLSETDPFIIREMNISLARLGDLQPLHEYIQELESSEERDDKDYRFELNYFDGDTVALVEEGIRRLSIPNYSMREQMIRAIGRHGDSGCIPILVPFLEDSIDFIKEAAEKAIAKISKRPPCQS